MRGILLGALIGLFVGSLSTWAYSHYLGEGQQLAQAQAEIATASTTLTKTAEDGKKLKDETQAMTAQIEELSSSNDKLKHQVEELKAAAPPATTTTPPVTNALAGMIQTQMAHHNQEKLLLLKSRLYLTPDQEAQIKAAMDAEDKYTTEMASKMYSGGGINFPNPKDSMPAKSVDQTISDILTPEQKPAYDQMKTDEKNSAAETMASVEMNQMSPLLQLSDAQKDQVYSAIYQSQLDMQDPAWIKNNMAR